MKKIIYIFLISFLFSACVKEEIDLHKISTEIDVSPSVIVPLIYGEVTIDKILPETEGEDFFIFIDSENNNLLHLRFNTELDSFSIGNFMDAIPNQDTAVFFEAGSFGTAGVDYDFSTSMFNNNQEIKATKSLYFKLNPDAGVDLLIDSMKIKSGNLIVNVQTDFNYNGTYTIKMPNVISPDGDTLTAVFSGADQSTIDISNYSVGLISDDNKPNHLKVEYSIDITKSNMDISDGNSISCTITTEDLEVNSVYGYIGQYIYELELDTMELGFNNQLLTGDLFIAEPSVSLILENSFGFPMRTTLSPDMKAIINGEADIPFEVNAENNPKDIAYPMLSEIGQAALDTIVIDEQTSNITDILSAMPDKLTIGGKFEINPDNDKNIYNFITEESYLKASLAVDLPINFEVANLAYSDTFEMDLSETVSNLEDVTNLELDLNFTNGLPIEFKAQLYFYEQISEFDTTIAVLPTDSLMQNDIGFLIKSATTSGGIVTSETNTLQTISLTGERLQKIKDTKYIVIRMYLETDQAGNAGNHNPVKIHSSDSFSFKIGAKASVSVQLE